MPCSSSSSIAKAPTIVGLPVQISHSDILRKFSPAKWSYVASNVDKAVSEDVPTIIGYKTAYGEKSVSEWMYAQVLAIYATSSNRDSAMESSIRDFARGFIADVGGYKLTELMLFFNGYKLGKFGKAYASFDARQIGVAFYDKFVPYIQTERGKYFRKENQKHYVNDRFTPPPGYSPLQLYKTLKRYAEEGDEQAKSIINNPNATTDEIEAYLNSK